jgi:hypothetical protein
VQPALFVRGIDRYRPGYVRTTIVVLLLYFTLTSIDWAQELMHLRFLPGGVYGVVSLVAVVWALGMHALWQIRKPNPYLDGKSGGPPSLSSLALISVKGVLQ